MNAPDTADQHRDAQAHTADAQAHTADAQAHTARARSVQTAESQPGQPKTAEPQPDKSSAGTSPADEPQPDKPPADEPGVDVPQADWSHADDAHADDGHADDSRAGSPAARREADALRRDREKADRDAAREVERARQDREKADRDQARDDERRARDAERRERDLRKAQENADRERRRTEQEHAREAARRQAERERAAQEAAKEAGRALREAEKARRAAALAEQKAAREADNARRQAQRAEAPTTSTTDLTGLPSDIAVLWRTPDPARRGPRPGLTLDAIADAAIALADAEGLGAVSMARLAESLGFTTMSLYRYVASKDEVLSLMSDRASGRPPAVGPEVGDWRARLEVLLTVQQPVLRAHPWMAQTTSVLHAVGPNRLAWMEAMLAAFDGVPLAEADKLRVVGILASHMLDELRLVGALVDRGRAAQAAEQPDTGDVIRLLASPDEHPALLRAVGAGGFGPIDEQPDEQPDEEALGFGTVLLLDGIERLVDRASRAQPTPSSAVPAVPAPVSDPPATLGT